MTTGCWQQRNDSNSKRKLQEKIFLTLRIFWNSLLAVGTLPTLGTLEPLSTSALGGSLWALFIGKALGYLEGFMPLMSSTCM